MTTPRFNIDLDQVRTLAAAGRFAGYGIKDVDTFDPRELLDGGPTTNDETIGDLIRGAWKLGALTGPGEPLFLYEEEPDSYYFRFDLGEHPARARLLTDGQEWRRISDEVAGVDAMTSVLQKMVDELNSTVASFDNYATALAVA